MKLILRNLTAVLVWLTAGVAVAQPANDNFANRITLTGAAATVTGSNVGATTEGREPTGSFFGGWGATVWYRWSPPANGVARMDTIGSDFNTVLAVYTGSAVNGLTQVAQNDNATDGVQFSRLTFNAQAGTEYQIQVSGSRGSGFPRPPAATGNFQLNVGMPPTITLTAPAPGSFFVMGSNILLSALASSPMGTVTQVDFFNHGELVDRVTAAPYETVLSSAAPGSNALYAVVTDSTSQVATSAVVNILVAGVGVTILSPIDGATFANTNPITVNVFEYLPAGDLTNVEFRVDGVPFAEDDAAPFSAVWNAVTGGSHRLVAVGRDNLGQSYFSAPVNFGVVRTLVARGADWKYLDNGSDQGTAWTETGFNDADWAQGPAELGYGDGDEATVVSSGGNPENVFATTYFRHSFTITNLAQYTNVLMNVKRDDGAVVHLNGVEAARFNMPGGTITFQTYALNSEDDGANFYAAAVPPSFLVEGTNVVAVEIHQANATSTDISFDMDLLGAPVVTRNASPTVTLTAPAHHAAFLAPLALTLTAEASDEDGTVAKVEFYVDDVIIGDDLTAPYSASWNNPTLGEHAVYAVAIDNLGASQRSDAAAVTIYDAVGTPFVQMTSPPDGLSGTGPTNLLLAAEAKAYYGVTNVQFLANGTMVGQDSASPYEYQWDKLVATNALTAVAYDANGRTRTSAMIQVAFTIPPTNTVAPRLSPFKVPGPGSTLGSLTTIRVQFTEFVINVDAGDLVVNGMPCTYVEGNGTIWIFTVPPQPNGLITVSFDPNHGITDLGYPDDLPFDHTAAGTSWTYTLTDRTAPTVVGQNPPAGALLTNLTAITVTFSEDVTGVDAADLLINGTPAFGLNGSGSNYLFTLAHPAGTIAAITWAAAHGIVDLAPSPNAFSEISAGATWSYSLDNSTVLVHSNATWRLLRGTAEASEPTDAWRQLAFDDTSWTNTAAPFYFGDPYNTPGNPGTLLNDMANNYNSIFLRRTFTLPNAAGVTNLYFHAQSDDGFIAWINGIEVLRFNMADGNVPFDGGAMNTANEPNNNGAAYLLNVLNNAEAYLQDGTNLLAVHAFNQSLNSSDFGFNLHLYTFVPDPALVPPVIARVEPPAGAVFYLTNLTVKFSEPVRDVSDGDLLVNGVPATSVTILTNTTFSFRFPQPPYGPVTISWSVSQDISDFDAPPKYFNGASPNAIFHYNLLNPSAPIIAAQTPLAGLTLNQFTQLSVTFNEPVTGVDAADLLVNAVPATGVTGGGANYTFTFPQPDYGPVAIGWAAGHDITDLEVPANAFEPARQSSTWSYALVDQTAPVIAVLDPPAGAQVTNLTEITLTFSESVTGVGPGDLLVNGLPITSVTGTNATYIFTFPQPNATFVTFTWANNHGIRDLAPIPNSFDATAPGASWSYTTPDNLPPVLAGVAPTPFVTIRALTQVRVTFTEPVTGLDTNDLRLNDTPALTLNGAGAGPYTFSFLPPNQGVVEVRWSPAHGITDLATPPNAFAGGEWTYVLDPNATFAGNVVISEIMFNPLGGRAAEEWIELHNVTADPINLAGWRFTRGVQFTFPNVSIPAQSYLVVAADTNAFILNYPTATNVVGGWTGQLANSDESLALETATGENVNEVHYASAGDWARRERGHGAEVVTSLTRAGNTATVTVFDHGYTGNDRVLISGADQPEYNGLFTVGNAGRTTFTLTVPATPDSPATGRIIVRQVVDDGFSGWSWFSEADGFGSSLELVHPRLSNASGQNWLPSTTLAGTPGRANSVASTNVAPLLLGVTHFPPVPRSTDTVTVTARVSDELTNGVQSVDLFYRLHTGTNPNGFLTTNMLDTGTRNDGLSGDGLFGAVLPALANGTVVEFYVQATDTTGLTRTWPAPTWDTNNTFSQLANALYQVDNETIAARMPVLRLVMSGTERAIFPHNDRDSDAEENVTLISTDGDGTKIRYLCGVRIRGAGSRSRTPPNNRLNIPNDNRWNGLSAVNLNSQFIHAQLIGAAVARRAGLPAADARVIQYRINGNNPAPINAPNNGTGNGAGYGAFLLLEPVNGDLAEDLFPEDGDGNVYRASMFPHDADLNYQGTNPDSYLARGYFKTSNGSENDWTDLQNLTFAFSQIPEDAAYVQAIRTNVNVTKWMTYFAVGTLINYGETSMFNGRGDDYALYRGVTDPRFVALGHDFDTIFGQGDTTGTYATSTGSSIYIMLNPPNTGGNAPNMPLLRRFLTHPEFAPLFFAELKRLTDTVLSAAELNPLMDQLLTWENGPTTVTRDAMKNHAANRRATVVAQIPLALTVSNALQVSNGYPFTGTPNVTLFGTAHAMDTRKILVNGGEATWSAMDARWTNTLALQPGLNTVLVQSLDSNNVEFARAVVEVWYDSGGGQSVSGTIGADTAWSPAGGPYTVTATLTVAGGATLTILPGTTVYLNSGVDLVVANGGRLIAEGTDTARIRFGRLPGSAATWGGLTVNGSASSPETRIAYAHFEGNGDAAIHATDGTVFLDHLTFGNTARQYVSLDRSSFVVQDCVFPTATGQFELLHGSGGIKAGGRGIFQRNFFGAAIGYNDVVDFSGGNRPGPIVQFLNNVFVGSDDDHLDLDSTDAWVEGNIFLHAHRNGSPDSASAVSGGSDNADTSEVTIVGNLFYDCDQAALAKQGNFYTMINNTVVRQTIEGSEDPEGGVIIMADEGTAEGAGFYLEGNIIYDAESLVRNRTASLVTFTNNLISHLEGAPWTGPGGNNLEADPLFNYVPQFAETTNFTSWAAAQVMWDWFSLRTGSPAVGAGPNGRDLGAALKSRISNLKFQRGVSVSGEPASPTPSTSAILRVGVNRTGSGIPADGFPSGSGYTHYRWRLDGGAWSAETPTATPITLSNLSGGPHYVEVVGRRDAGFYQDDPVYGTDAFITVSRTWTVNPNASPLRLNEILASNGGAVTHHGTTPDAIELYNASDSTLDLTGLRLTDDPANPDQFIFPAGASVPARGYLVVYANNPDGTPGYHLGFNLNQSGDAVYLFASAARGGALLDSVQFGLQLTDQSIGRLDALADPTAGGQDESAWGLAQPTFGTANRAAQLGDPRGLRLNEWLAIAQTPFNNDFIELYNPAALPVALARLYVSDEILGWPGRHQIAPLSFIAGYGYLRLFADGEPGAGADHLNFALNGDQGTLGLFLPDLTPIDTVWYQAQWPNVSQGRSPNAPATLVYFDTPTPGAPNPIVSGPLPFGGALVINEVLAVNATLAEAGRTPDWVELYNGTTNAIDLGDLSLTDDTLQPRRFVFAAGTSMAPGGWVRVVCDPGSILTGPLINTNFALKSTGGGVYLFDTPAGGGALLNAIVYGLQTPDLTIGRVPDGGTNWGLTTPTPDAPNTAVPTLGDAASLRLNEWMAAPASGDDWFELYNPTLLPIALGGLHLTDDLNDRTKHQMVALSFVGTGTNGFVEFRADSNTGAGADHVNFALRAAGEAIGLSTEAGTLMEAVTFGQQQSGVSEGRFPDGAETFAAFPGTASPGAANWRWLTNLVINEVLTHTDPPLEDAIELRNLTAQPVDLSGWWLSDDNGTLDKYQIPTPTVVPANGYVVIYETAFTNAELASHPFALSSKGDEVVLSAAADGAMTGWRTSVKFGAAAGGVSFGRYVTSDQREELVAMSERTFGADDPGSVEEFRTGTGLANAYPRVGPVAISEVMYHPPDLGTNDNTRDEFIELHNLSTAPVALYDTTNVWRLRDAVDFDFPPGTVIQPGDYLLVVSFDPVNNPAALADFRATYSLSLAVAIVGPWSGKLANDTDDIELRRPDTPDTNDVPYLLVERVRYSDQTPWPTLADGTGFSLQRAVETEFGNDPINWTAAAPTPGPASAPLDADGDGMPDSWENFYGLNPLDPTDALLDRDGDGLANRREFELGTDPTNPADGLLLDIATAPSGGGLVLTFMALANQAYVLEYAETLGGEWRVLETFAASAEHQLVQYPVPATLTARFYRFRME